MENKDFDIIISNPPYGKIGNAIVKNIVENIDYKEYVNLMPINDYYRGDKHMSRHVQSQSIETIRNGFEDAAVTAHLTKISKKPYNSITREELYIKAIDNKILDKYFYKNILCHDLKLCSFYLSDDYDKYLDPKKTLLFHFRDMVHGHLPYSRHCTTTVWNLDNRFNGTLYKEGSFLTYVYTEHKFNYVNFLFSKDGFRFISLIFSELNIDCSASRHFSIALPNIEMRQPMNLNDVLKYYEYSDKEVKEIKKLLEQYPVPEWILERND